MRQTVIALRAGSVMDEYNHPGEATVHVLHGQVLLTTAGTEWNDSVGNLLTRPDSRHRWWQ
ncbi:cupin domain-containing protein [Kocuria rosea]|uniref:hypothetical protein n=1 Tax=Kocuria rosea TaxID=1275 RepID=UPI002B2402AA|nr:hypothetical protein [Kocuria rosea]MEB2528351.1 hypothetical protein [Kocuria rosea]MEB2617852.1 hypothetical protein [Kocuria rosea]